MTDDPETPDGMVKVTFYLAKTNHELLWTAAADQGESFTATLNRAVGLYEIMHRAEPGMTVKWRDGNSVVKRVLILSPVNAGESRSNLLWFILTLIICSILASISLYLVDHSPWSMTPLVVALLAATYVISREHGR